MHSRTSSIRRGVRLGALSILVSSFATKRVLALGPLCLFLLVNGCETEPPTAPRENLTSAPTARTFAAGGKNAAQRISLTLVGAASYPWRINERGQAVGTTLDGTQEGHAFVWRDGTMTDIGGLPGAVTSSGTAINDRGQVVGTSGLPTTNRAFLWDQGVMTDLGSLADEPVSANDINNRGQIVGASFVAGSPRAYLWQDGAMNDLGTLPGGVWAWPYAINDRGQVVGISQPGSSYVYSITHATVWQQGTVIDLTPDADPLDQTVAFDINNAGQIVGVDHFDTSTSRFVMWQDGSMIELDMPPGYGATDAIAINERGEVLFQAYALTGSAYGTFLWQHGAITNLNDLVGGVFVGSGFNNHGQFVGAQESGGFVLTTHGQIPGS